MATYSITTTSDQEALVTWIVSQYNIEHDTSFTNAQYITMRFAALLEPFVMQYKATVQQQLKEAFSAADAAIQQQVLSLLGLP